jgi:hypothetical protein
MMRFFWYVGLACCMVFLCACDEEAARQSPESSAGGEAQAVETSTPQASLRVQATLVAQSPYPEMKQLTPVARFEKEPVEALPTVDVPSSLQAVVDQALNDLAERLAVGVEQIDVVEIKSVVWPDGALGCPQPGLAYIQVQQEGLFIRLRVEKRVYNYHSGGGSGPFFCKESIIVNEDLAPSPGLGNE